MTAPLTTLTLGARHWVASGAGGEALFHALEQNKAAHDLANEEPQIPEAFFSAGLINPHSSEATQERYQKLREQNHRYMGWLPGFSSTNQQKLELVLRQQAERAVHTIHPQAAPTLAGSILLRHRVALAQNPHRVLVVDDIDGLGLVLAENTEVLWQGTSPWNRAWLQQESSKRELQTHARFIEPGQSHGSCDVAILALGHPLHSVQALHNALDALKPGGHVVASVYGPWARWWFQHLQDWGISLLHQYREQQYRYLLGGHVIDGAGDLLVLKPTGNKVSVPPLFEQADSIGAMPHLWVDFDDLAAEKIMPGVMEQLADRLDKLGPYPEQNRTITEDKEYQMLAWCDVMGFNITGILATQPRHFFFSLAPYHPGLESAAMHAILQVLGDCFTRIRPLLTHSYLGENIVG